MWFMFGIGFFFGFLFGLVVMSLLTASAYETRITEMKEEIRGRK